MVTFDVLGVCILGIYLYLCTRNLQWPLMLPQHTAHGAESRARYRPLARPFFIQVYFLSAYVGVCTIGRRLTIVHT